MAKRPCHEGTEKAKEIRGLRVPSAHQFIIHGIKTCNSKIIAPTMVFYNEGRNKA